MLQEYTHSKINVRHLIIPKVSFYLSSHPNIMNYNWDLKFWNIFTHPSIKYIHPKHAFSLAANCTHIHTDTHRTTSLQQFHSISCNRYSYITFSLPYTYQFNSNTKTLHIQFIKNIFTYKYLASKLSNHIYSMYKMTDVIATDMIFSSYEFCTDCSFVFQDMQESSQVKFTDA